ncbi:MAG: alginate export family protein [Leptospiraceae bacterium]|nr:alginate export family protein [Leptospiraceae bacterium]
MESKFIWIRRSGLFLSLFVCFTYINAQETPTVNTIEPKASEEKKVPDWINNLKFGGLIRFRPEFKRNYDYSNKHTATVKAVASDGTTPILDSTGKQVTYIQNKEADNVEFVGQKVQFSISTNFSKDVEGKITFQDARVWGGQTGSINGLGTANANTSESVDIREAWIEVKNLPMDLNLQAGRQIMAYGDLRLVAHLDWMNVGRSFDGLRFKHESKYLSSHAWGMVISEKDSDIVGNVSTATAGDAYFTGWYNTLKLHEQFNMDLYYLGIHKTWTQANAPAYTIPNAQITVQDRTKQRDNLLTFGARLTNRTKKNEQGAMVATIPFDWTFEYAIQTGKSGEEIQPAWDTTWGSSKGTIYNVYTPYDPTNPGASSIIAKDRKLYKEKVRYDSFAFAFDAGYTIQKKFRIGVEYDVGSGDPNRADGKKSTFQNLFHLNHVYYGIADQVSWQNMVGKSINLKVKLGEWGKLMLAFWHVDKHKSQDAWYGVAGGSSTTASTESKSNSRYVTTDVVTGRQVGSLGKHLFKEYDIQYDVDYKGVNWSLGGSAVYAGDAAKGTRDNTLEIQQSLQKTGTPPVLTALAFNPRATFFYIMMGYKF